MFRRMAARVRCTCLLLMMPHLATAKTPSVYDCREVLEIFVAGLLLDDSKSEVTRPSPRNVCVMLGACGLMPSRADWPAIG